MDSLDIKQRNICIYAKNRGQIIISLFYAKNRGQIIISLINITGHSSAAQAISDDQILLKMDWICHDELVYMKYSTDCFEGVEPNMQRCLHPSQLSKKENIHNENYSSDHAFYSYFVYLQIFTNYTPISVFENLKVLLTINEKQSLCA